MTIYLTSKFRKAYKRLPKQIKEKAKEKEKVFRKNPFNSQLETHRLHGMFQFLDATKTKVAFINIGTHKIYK